MFLGENGAALGADQLGFDAHTGMPVASESAEGIAALHAVRQPLAVLRHDASGAMGLCNGVMAVQPEGWSVHAWLPALYPEWLGDPRFCAAHGTRFAYITGEMANGIASEAMVIAAGQCGTLGFFGSAGLSTARIEQAIATIRAALDPEGRPWGVNLIHTPTETGLEESLVDLYLAHGVTRMSASAFLDLQLSIVRYACRGLYRDEQGRVCRINHLFPKVSRVEVARPFMLPPPKAMLDALVAQGALSADEATLALEVPLAEDITAEADSGGHTDNRPLPVLLSDMRALRDEMVRTQGYDREIRIGAAGGLGTPDALAAAFAMGAAYVLTGSVNQSAVESGLAPVARAMLASVKATDVGMGACADMFEMGVKVQVLKRGTMFASRANQLHRVYVDSDSLEAIPAATRTQLEKTVFRKPLDEVWAETQSFFQERDPHQLERAAKDPKHRMALVFRWYLGQSSQWPIRGVEDRQTDFQVWCGPAMGAFNTWVKGSSLEPMDARTVDQIARNLLEGAAVITRAQQVRALGVPVPAAAFRYVPQPLLDG